MVQYSFTSTETRRLVRTATSTLTQPMDSVLNVCSQHLYNFRWAGWGRDLEGGGGGYIKEKLHGQGKDWNNVTHRQGNLIGRSEKGVFVTKAIYLSVKCGQPVPATLVQLSLLCFLTLTDCCLPPSPHCISAWVLEGFIWLSSVRSTNNNIMWHCSHKCHFIRDMPELFACSRQFVLRLHLPLSLSLSQSNTVSL